MPTNWRTHPELIECFPKSSNWLPCNGGKDAHGKLVLLNKAYVSQTKTPEEALIAYNALVNVLKLLGGSLQDRRLFSPSKILRNCLTVLVLKKMSNSEISIKTRVWQLRACLHGSMWRKEGECKNLYMLAAGHWFPAQTFEKETFIVMDEKLGLVYDSRVSRPAGLGLPTDRCTRWSWA